MPAAPRAHELGGAVWWVREPDAGAVLDLTARLPGRALVACDAQGIAGWIGAHLEGVQGVEGDEGEVVCEGWPVWRRIDLVDRLLTGSQQVELATRVMIGASLTDAARADLKAALAVFWGGGCACPGCVPPPPGRPAPPARAAASCLYTVAQRDALHTALMLGVCLDAPTLTGSWWAWQVATIWRGARAEREAARRREQEERDRVDRRLKQMGMIPA